MVKNILVVGAGIAGTTVCYWLKRFGFSPTLIEKSAGIRLGGHGLDIRGAAIDLVKQMGIYEQICDRRTRIETGHIVDVLGQQLHQEQAESFAFRQGDDVEILRGNLLNILMQTIKTVPCYFNQSIKGIEQNSDHVTVYFKDARVQNYDLVIGADGIHSLTRKMIFADDEYRLIQLNGIIFSIFTIPNYLNLHRAEVMCETDQKLISITNDQDPNTMQVCLNLRSQQTVKNIGNQKEQMQFLKKVFADFGWEAPKVLELMSASEDFYFDSATQVKMDSWTHGRVALIGDAAYSPSPLSGQGNNLAMIGAYVLAGELKRSQGDYEQAFKCYHQLLQPFVKANQDLGVFSSESFLVPNISMTKEVVEERSTKLWQMVQDVSNAFPLPDYS